MVDTAAKFRGLILSAIEVKELNPDWSDAMVEDYLNILQSLITLATEVDKVGSGLRVTTRVTFADSPYQVQSGDYELFIDTDGGPIIVNLPAGVDGKNYRMINVGSSDNDVTLNPFGSEFLFGENNPEIIFDDEVLIMTFETDEGWY